MTYRLNAEKSILYKGNIPLLKAADDTGKFILSEILNMLNKKTFQTLPLTYVDKQKVWLSTKHKFVVFNVAKDDAGTLLIGDYQEGITNEGLPEDTQVVNINNALSSDTGGIVTSNEGNVIDLPKASEKQNSKLEKN